MQHQQLELKNLIQFAFAQRKFKKVIELANNYLAQFPQSKEIHLIKAKAHSQLTLPQECLKDLQRAKDLGSSLKQISALKIRSLIESSQIKEAEKQMKKLIQQDKQLKTAFDLYHAINLLKDDFQTHKLTEKQETTFEAMKTWLYKNGAQYEKLKPVNVYPGYRGVIATKHIKKKQPIVFIPKSELITLEMARANPLSQSIISKNIKLHSPKHTLLSILLLQLKNTADSKYKPYIDLLPEDHSCFPINYSKSELAMLEGSPFLEVILEKVMGLRKDYDTIIKCDPKIKKYSFQQFCWARNMVGSRIFGLVINGVKTQILVPFADMLNHHHPKQTVWSYSQSMNGFVIESEEDIEVGQQVFDSYGRKCNSRYLLSYGFTLEDNEDNQISIKIEIDEKDPLAQMKKQIIKEDVNQAYIETRKINLNFHNNKFYEFMGALRFLTIDQEETLHMLKKISNIEVTKQPYIMVRTPPISVKNQIKVWAKLGSLCQNLLSKYPHTLDHDRALLKNTRKFTENERNILNLRMGQKHILGFYISACADVVRILNSPDIIEALQQSKSKIYAKYLFKILSLTPGINKKNLEKRLSPHFSTLIEEKQLDETEEVPQS